MDTIVQVHIVLDRMEQVRTPLAPLRHGPDYASSRYSTLSDRATGSKWSDRRRSRQSATVAHRVKADMSAR